MQSLFLVNPDEGPFDASSVERALRSCPQLTDFRFDDPFGSLIEFQYREPDDWATFRLDGDGTAIVCRGNSDAALRAILLVQKALGRPLRLFDSGYNFDLTFSDIATIEELEAAMKKASTS